MKDPRIVPIRHVMSNGVVVIVVENHSNLTLELYGRIKLAGMGESTQKAGITGFAARMLQRGTASRTSLQVASEVESLGAQIWSGGGVDAVSFGMNCLSRDFEAVLAVLADVVLNPIFPEDEIEKLKSDLKARLKEEKDDPSAMARREIFKMIYPEGHPYRNSMGVDEESLDKIEMLDLVNLHRRYYIPDTAMITVVGDLKAEDAISKIESVFGGWNSNGDPANFDFESLSVELQPAIWRRSITIPSRPQAEVLIGHKGISRRDPDFYSLMLLNEILSGFGGRLFSNIRDNQGLVYGVGSSFTPALGEGPFLVRLGTNPKNVDRAVESVLAELRKIQVDLVSDSELEDAKSSLIGRSALAMETNGGIAGMFLNSEFYGLGIDYVYEYPEFYKSVSKSEVREAAERNLHLDRYSMVIAGP